MKRALVASMICFAAFTAPGCDVDPAAVLAGIQSTLPADGTPTMDSVACIHGDP